MKLYKYCDPKRIEALQNGTLHFADLIKFNDPFELNPSVWATPSAIFPITQVILGEINRHVAPTLAQQNKLQRFLMVNLVLPFVFLYYMPRIAEIYFDAYGQTRRTAFKKLYDDSAAAIGIVSLSEEPLDLLMWSHYSSGHTGFVLEFDTAHDFFGPPAKPTEIEGLHQIKYSKKRPIVPHGKGLEISHVLTKSKEWAYEKEWRLIRRVDNNPNRNRNVSFPPGSLTRILIGCRADSQLRQQLAAIARSKKYPNLVLEQLKISDVNYRLIEGDPLLVSEPNLIASS